LTSGFYRKLLFRVQFATLNDPGSLLD